MFHELNIGSVTCLHDFYQKRILNYSGHMEDLCRQLDTEYEKLKEPMVQKQPDTLSVIRYAFMISDKIYQGAQWLSGRVLDSRPKGRRFEPHRRHCVVVLEQDTFILA